MKNGKIIIHVMAVLLLVITPAIAKAESVLDKKITYKAKNITIKKALVDISVKYKIAFSYSESMLPVLKTTSINVEQKSLSYVLDKLLGTVVKYKEINGQVVLMRNKTAPVDGYTVSGYVTEKGSGEQLLGVSIFVPGTTIGTTTNAYGFYSLTVKKGTYKLLFSYIGYEAQQFELDMNRDQELHVELSGMIETATVEVVGEAAPKESQKTQMSSIEIPVEQIKEIPALLGEKDVLKVIQLMPGVQKGSEGQSGFYVRGGGPDQNLIILDGAPVYNASHMFGFFSVFNGDALKSVELIKGGFPSRYGGRLSSVIDMHMKEGNKEKFKAEAGIGLIASRFLVEGPLKKNKSSFIVSGRRTYLDALIYPFLAADSKLGYYFYDLNAKVNYDFGKKDKIYLSGYFGKDKIYARQNDENMDFRYRIEWGNATGTARWNHQFNNKMFANTGIIFSNYRFLLGANQLNKVNMEEFNMRFYSQIRDYSFKYDVDYYLSNNHHFKFGALATLHRFSPSALVYKDTYSGDNINNKKIIDGYETGLYAEDDMRLGSRVKINMGLRMSSFTNRQKTYIFPEPRFSAAWQLKKDMAIKSSFAIMNQFMHLLSNTGIGLPTDLWVPATSHVPPQRSMQVAAGFVKDFLKQNLTFSVEGYYKEMYHILSYKEGATFLIFDDPLSADDYSWENNVTSGKGWSYGTEFLLQRKKGRLNGWIGYTLSWTQLQFPDLNLGKKYWAKYDRRHDISVVGMYKINDKISLSTTWVYGTGQAITLPLGTYGAVLNNPGGGVGTPSIQDYNGKNSFRMAPYHRMDFGVRFTKKREKYERTTELSVYNLYNRANPFYYYASTNAMGETKLKQVSIFGFLPSISVNYKF